MEIRTDIAYALIGLLVLSVGAITLFYCYHSHERVYRRMHEKRNRAAADPLRGPTDTNDA